MKRLTMYFTLSIVCITSAFGQKQSDSLFVFVGEKIKADKFRPQVVEGQITIDEAFYNR